MSQDWPGNWAPPIPRRGAREHALHPWLAPRHMHCTHSWHRSPCSPHQGRWQAHAPHPWLAPGPMFSTPRQMAGPRTAPIVGTRAHVLYVLQGRWLAHEQHLLQAPRSSTSAPKPTPYTQPLVGARAYILHTIFLLRLSPGLMVDLRPHALSSIVGILRTIPGALRQRRCFSHICRRQLVGDGVTELCIMEAPLPSHSIRSMRSGPYPDPMEGARDHSVHAVYSSVRTLHSSWGPGHMNSTPW